MFHAVRQWWSEGRGKLTARLFFFELVVVILGVLIAQGLAGWVQDRAALRAMEESRARMLVVAGYSAYVAKAWQRAYPCLVDRMEAVMVAAGEGPVDDALVIRPSLLTAAPLQMSDQSELLFRARYGDDAALAMSTIAGQAVAMTERTTRASSAWGRLLTAASSSGQVSPADRAAARQSAADVIAELRGIKINADTILLSTRKLGVKSSASDAIEHRFGPAQTCAAIWKSGRIDPPLGMH